MVSLAYYLRVVAAMWMPESGREGALPAAPVMAGGAPEADELPLRRSQPEVVAVAVLMGAATLFFGVIPGPLLSLASDAAASLGL